MSFNQFSQMLEELQIIQQFKAGYSDFPKGKLEKSESPDFILRLTAKSAIGIELTKMSYFNRGQNPRVKAVQANRS